MQGTTERLFLADPEDNPVPFDTRRHGCDCCGTTRPPIHVRRPDGGYAARCQVCLCNAAGES